MTIFAGLDVNDKTTHICVVEADGAVLKRDVVANDPAVLAKWLSKHCRGLARVVLETGPLSTLCTTACLSGPFPSNALVPDLPRAPYRRG